MPKSTRSSGKRTPSTPPEEKVVSLRPVAWYALEPVDFPELAGYHFSGATPEAALINARAYLSTWGKVRNYNLTIKEE